MSDFLFLFSISPVQSFISQARKTKDLYAGSKLLSQLIKKQINKILENENVELIFPNINSDSIPNRFVAKISNTTESEIEILAESLKTHLKNCFIEYAKKSLKEISQNFHFSQLEEFFSIHWSASEIKDNYKSAYINLEKLNAAVKNIRMFKQLGNGEGEQGRKCSICGERNAYFYKTTNGKKPAFIDANATVINRDELNQNEALCSVCAVKRFFPDLSFPSTAEICLKGTITQEDIRTLGNDPQLFYPENLTNDYLNKNGFEITLEELKNLRKQILKRSNLKASDLPKYYGIIAFDGDNMGKLLSGSTLKDNVKLEEFHMKLAESLSSNAKKAKDIVDNVGKTVYTGGDDFLGFCPLNKVLSTIKLLNDNFKKEVNDKLQPLVQEEVTMSAGIAIAHYKTPLSIALNWARKMENEAKKTGYRNAFAIAILKHSGEIHKTVWKWENSGFSNVENMEKIILKLTTKLFSTNFIYTLEKEFEKLDYSKNETYEKQFVTELKRLIHKSNIMEMDEGESDNDFILRKQKEEDALFKLCYGFFRKADEHVKRYFSLMRIIAFWARQNGGEK